MDFCKPKPLGGDRAGQWSRRITEKHRLVYLIEEEKVNILILSTYGHYNDK
ncbi:MAG TPA: type II toxin-antitoxin system YoeB family toxin [Paludibacter sp.]|nr:type II toxin-antitoxin system YoeB family toxin [Paludibacter sp.]